VPANHVAIAVPSVGKIEKIVYNLLKTKRRYFQVAFCCERRKILKNILKDRKIEK